MTPEQTSAAARRAVLELGDAYSHDPETMSRARRLGLTGWAFHVASRAGVLGDVRPATVAAALAFVAPEAVASGWESARRVAAPVAIAEQSLAECCRWGRERLEAMPGLARMVELAERVVVHAEPAGAPLFAAWRAMPVPDDAPGAQAAVVLRLLREHRAAAFAMGVRASGLTPLEAIIGGPEGEAGARAAGWPPPYPPVASVFRRRVWADALTDRIASQAYGVLDARERVELVNLLDAALATLGGSGAAVAPRPGRAVPAAEWTPVPADQGTGSRVGRARRSAM